MKLITHIIFSFTLVYLISIYSGSSYLDSMWLAVSSSIAINYVIDVFGHTHSKKGSIIRSKATHSLSTASIIGIVIGLAIAYFMNYDLVLGVLSGLATSLSHLFLDSLTMSGIYICGRRHRIASYRYDNPVLNSGFIVSSIFLLYLTLYFS